MYFFFLVCNKLENLKEDQMTTQQLLNNHLLPNQDARYSGYGFAYGKASQEPITGFGGLREASDKAQTVSGQTRFDLASITKLYTATLAAKLHSSDRIDIQAPLSSWFECSSELGDLSAAELLTHSSGLPPIWEEQYDRENTIQALLDLTPDPLQRGSMVYSCTGYSLFAVACESLLGKRFDQIIQQMLLDPIGLLDSGFLPSESTADIAVSCEPIEPLKLGAVHDPRARAMGGVSGNAGIFATATDVHKFFSEVVSGEKGVVGDAERKVLFTPLVIGEWQQSIGFRYLDTERLGSREHFFSHTGFTGTLLMVEPDTKEVAVMLTNRLTCETTREQMAPVYVEFAQSWPRQS